MKIRLLLLGLALAVASAAALGGCGGKEEAPDEAHAAMEHAHAGSGDIPAGLREAPNPAYPPGSRAMIRAEHMAGMDGAEATIVGAYDTTVYAVTYTPPNGGPQVSGHKWVVHEEIDRAADAPYAEGAEVVLNAEHMAGMKGARAVVDFAERTTVYMVDYTPVGGGAEVTNHQWVVESELSAP